MVNYQDFERPCRVQVEEARSWKTLFRKRRRTIFMGYVRSWDADDTGMRIVVEDRFSRSRSIANVIVFPGSQEGNIDGHLPGVRE